MIEYEKLLYGYNKQDIIEQLESNGFAYKGTYLFKILNFKTDNTEFKTIRLRDEGHRITFTTKKIHSSEYDEEYEVNVSDFNIFSQMLKSLGFKEKDYYEKMRQIYTKG